MKKSAALLIGFGGPRDLSEVQPFLKSIVDGANIPQARLDEVYRHYEVIGGKSFFNEITETQKKAIEKRLNEIGHPMPVGVAYRHSTPTFKDVFEQFKRYGVTEVSGFILASFRSFVSREWYWQKAEEGRKLAGADEIRIRYTGSFDHDANYHRAQAAKIEEVWRSWSAAEREATCLIFTAHSIPSFMCEQSCSENDDRCYGFQFYQASKAVAGHLNARHWKYCYQSRSGNPRDLWLDPDVKDVIRALDTARFKRVLLVPVGFLCDNVEVVYDLDIEAKKTAEERGLKYFRSGTVADHPIFVEMVTEHILESLKA